MAHVGLYCWMSISIAWSSGCAFGMTFNKVCSSSVTCITNYWENAMNLPIFQAPSCSAFSSSKMQLSSFSNGSKQWPQLATGIQVLGLSRCCCKSKVAMLWLDTLVSIRILAVRSALSQCSAVITCCATSQMHSPAFAIYGWVSWPKTWCNGSTNSAKAGTYSL